MSKKTVEQIKMIIIVVLFLATILLLYLIWGGSKEVKAADLIPSFGKDNEDTHLWSVVEPEKVYYSAGNGSFRCVTDSYYSYYNVMESFRNLSDNSTVMATEIARDQYEEALRNHPSIVCVFSYEFPFADLCAELGIGGSSAYAGIGNITEICLSSIAQDSLLVANYSSGKCYRLVSDSMSVEFKEPLNYRPDYFCYDVSSVLGAGGSGLFPLLTQTQMANSAYRSEGFFEAGESIEIARVVFGDSFDFVRRISDGFGNYTFMYGFGQKTLTLGKDGSVEYKTEAGSGNSQGFFGDLKVAENYFYNVLGHYITLNKTSASLKLKDVKQTGSGKTASYTFCFAMHFPPYDICGSEKYALEIKVEKGQVSWLKSTVVPVDIKYDPTLPHDVFDAANVLAANAPSSEAFISMAENYRSMEEVFFMKDGELIPAWRLTLSDGSVYYFDIITGEALN